MSADVTYDYRNDSLLTGIYFNESGRQGPPQKDRGAAFPGNQHAWSNYLLKNIRTPDAYEFKNGYLASVVIHASINAEGKIVAAYVKVPLHPKFDEMVLRAVKSSPNWEPAVHHNRKIYDELDVPVTWEQGYW